MNNREIARAGHLNDDEEWLCVILRVLQDVVWIGKSGYWLTVRRNHIPNKVRSLELTHVAAVSWFGRWTLCSSPVNHLEGRRHTDIRYGHRMQDERPYHPLRERLLVHVCCGAACLCFLTVVDAYVQLDFPQIYHGGHAERKHNVWSENVTSLQENVCVCVCV